MFLFAAEDSSSNGMSGESLGIEDVVAFPPPPPPTEISLLELPPKMLPHPGAEAFHIKELEIWPSVSSLPPVQMGSEVESEDNGKGSINNGQPTKPPSPPPLPPPPLPQSDLTTDVPVTGKGPAQVEPDSPQSLGMLTPSPGKDGPPLPTKPKPKL